MTETHPSPSLARVARGNLCAGCGLCAGVAPGKVAMRVEAPGFLRPAQTAPLDPAEEAAVAAACPGLALSVEAAGRPGDVLWGPYLSMRTGHATDPALRFAASSGGALSALLAHLLEAGDVEAVVANGADPALPIGNVTVTVADADGIAAAAGSRYAPSAPLAGLPGMIASGRRLAFVGKPCDAAALRALIRHRPELAATFPVILSFFCAGVPSHAGGRAVLAALGTRLADVAAFRFRGMGWPGRATATLRDGTVRDMSYHDSWGEILTQHVQTRCKICPDGTGMQADIVCADAWESDADGYPLFEERAGTSLIVARTERGAGIVAAAEAAGRIATAPFDPAGLAAIQPGQRNRRRVVAARLAGLRLAGRPIPRYRGLALLAAARQGGLRRHLEVFLGTLRRVARGRI